MADNKIEAAPPHAENHEMGGLGGVISHKTEEPYDNVIDPVMEKRVLRKMDRALIPLVTALCRYNSWGLSRHRRLMDETRRPCRLPRQVKHRKRRDSWHERSSGL